MVERVQRAGGRVLSPCSSPARSRSRPSPTTARRAASPPTAAARPDRAAHELPARRDDAARPARATLAPARGQAARRLQLRRDLAATARGLPHPVPLADRPDALRACAPSTWPPAAAPEADRRPARARREDARQTAHPRDERRRTLGVHALRRRRRAAVRPRARHGGARPRAASTSTHSLAGDLCRGCGCGSATVGARCEITRRRADAPRSRSHEHSISYAAAGGRSASPGLGSAGALLAVTGFALLAALVIASCCPRTPPAGSRAGLAVVDTPRRRFVWPRRFFSSSRRSFDAFVGFVGRRGRRTFVASRSCSRIRSVASSRFRSCERSSCAIARTTGPSVRARGAARASRERRRRLDVEDRLDARRALLRVWPPGPLDAARSGRRSRSE